MKWRRGTTEHSGQKPGRRRSSSPRLLWPLQWRITPCRQPRSIPIASITAQYLEFLQKAREMDLNISAEFVFMAATLIQIKSKMLLPTDPALRKEGEAEEDPREELVERLLEHERYKNAAEMLQQKRLIEENVWSNPQM